MFIETFCFGFSQNINLATYQITFLILFTYFTTKSHILGKGKCKGMDIAVREGTSLL